MIKQSNILESGSQGENVNLGKIYCPKGVRLIPLTQGQFAIVDAEDYTALNKYKWCASKAWNQKTYYARREENGKTIYMHRIIMNSTLGFYIDHCNGNGLDNRKSNLRLCNNAQNQANRQVHTIKTSKYKGVCFVKNAKKWQAIIKHNGENIRLGYFPTEQEAAKMYDVAAQKYFGDFAKLNLS